MRLRPAAALAFATALVLAAMLAPQAAAARELTYRYGPVSLEPYEVDQGLTFQNVPKPDFDGYITRMEVDLVDAAGRPISPAHLMLHHIVFLNLGEAGKFSRRDRTCSVFTGVDGKTKLPALADRFYAAGEERNVLQLPDGYGYKVSGKDNWILTWMFMNHRAHAGKAYIQYRISYESERALTPAYMVWLDVRNCLSDPVFDVPGGGAPGSTFAQSAIWTAPEPGRVVAGGGHLHGGGRDIRLGEPDCGDRELFVSRPLWGLASHPFYNVKPVLHEPGPIDMSGFTTAAGIPLARGERLRITASYDNSLPHVRVMGIMGVYFAPDASVTSPCGPLPALTTHASSAAGRASSPRFRIPLARRPRGKPRRLGRRARVKVNDFRFRNERIRVPRGAKVRWLFEGSLLHNVTVASGPRGFSSPNLDDRRSFSKRLTVPGTYKYFCTLHPTVMTGEVKVGGTARKK